MKNKKLIIGSVVGILSLLFVLFIANEISNLGTENKKAFELVDMHIKNGHLGEALVQATKHTQKFSSPKMEEKKAQIEKAMNLEEVELTLATMNEDRFEKLQSGVFNEKFFEDENINAYFIKLLKENSSNREALVASYKAEKESRRIAAEKALREEKINNLFSKYDNSHRSLVKLVEKNMNDPDSFEHVDTKVYDKETYLLVRMEYRGNNKFGAKVKESILAKVDFDGNVLSTEQE